MELGDTGAARLRRPLLAKSASREAKEADAGCLSEGSVPSSILLMCAAAIGTGVLALPYGVKCVGVLPALCLFALAGAAAYTSNVILFRCAQKTGLGSYGELMTDILGKHGAMVLDGFVCVEGLGAVATYLVFIMDYVPQVCAVFSEEAWCTDRINVVSAASLIIWPLSCLRGLGALRYVSTCSLLTIILTSLVVMAKAPYRFSALERPFMEAASEVHVGLGSTQAFSMACFAFMTHTNTPEIARQLRKPTPRRFHQVLCAHTLSLWAVYSAIGVCGFLSFLDATHQDFLTNYEIRDIFVVACRSLLSLTLVFACPMNIFPSMQALFNILKGLRPKSSGRVERSLYDCHEVRVPVTTACFAVSLGIALRSPHVADLISVISAFLSSPLMFAFPALMYLRILGQRDVAIPSMLMFLTVSLWIAELCRLLL